MKKLILVCLLMLGSHSLFAATCTNSVSVKNFTAALAGGSISIGQDMPVGSVIYQLKFNDPGLPDNVVSCGPGSFDFPQALSYSSNPLQLANWNNSPFPGKVYQTTIPGIGVAVSSDTSLEALPTTAYSRSYSANSTFPVRINAVLNLIKIGTISAGTINGSQLPSVQLDLGPSATVTNVTRIYNLNFTGSLAIVAPTCSVQDVNVPLGSYDVSDFASVGDSTPWIPVPITLTNCGQFSGYYNTAITSSGIGNSVLPGNRQSNNIILGFNPTSSLIDATTMSVTSTSKEPAATGIGIQMADDLKNSINFKSIAYPIRTENITNMNGGTIKQTFFARYIKTNAVMTPGRADGTVIFTVNYR